MNEPTNPTPEPLPPNVIPVDFKRPSVPPVFCIISPDLAGCLMTPVGPLLTIQLGSAQALAAQSGGQVMEWADAFPLLKNAPPPSPIVAPDGRPASAEAPKLIV